MYTRWRCFLHCGEDANKLWPDISLALFIIMNVANVVCVCATVYDLMISNLIFFLVFNATMLRECDNVSDGMRYIFAGSRFSCDACIERCFNNADHVYPEIWDTSLIMKENKIEKYNSHRSPTHDPPTHRHRHNMDATIIKLHFHGSIRQSHEQLSGCVWYVNEQQIVI